MSKSTRGIRAAGVASLAVSLSLGVAAPAFAVPDFAFDRIGGEDRYQTAADVADEYGVKPDAIVANGQPGFYADALASNYLSGVEDAPILLTRIKELPQHTLDQLDQMNAQNVWIVGGESVVPAEQEAQLESEGYNVVRIAGDDRFETNADVLAEGGASTGGLGLIATGFNFPDALAAGPFAYNGHSLGLSTKDDVKDVVLDALVADDVDEVLIFGGTDAVGPGVVADLASRGITVRQRFAGADRSETSELAAEWALANLNFTDTHVGVASGYTEGYGADALAGGPLEGMQDAPMLITRNVDNPDDVIDYLEAHCETLETGHIFGGPVAISVAAEAQMEEAASCGPDGGPVTNQTVTDRPELVSAQILETNASGPNAGTRIRYTFDENVTGKTPTPALFHAYMYDGTQFNAAEAIIDPTNNRAVLARFTGITSTTEPAAAGLTGAESLRVATVDFDAVRDDTASTTGPDAANPIGDAQLNAGSEAPGGTTGFTAGVTAAPDLVSITDIQQVPGQNRTVMTFNFDEAATIVNFDGDAVADDGFFVILQDGVTEIQGAVQNGNGTASIQVVFDSSGTGGLTAANVARGFVEAGVVSDSSEDAVVDNTGTPPADPAQGNLNPLQAADIGNSGNSLSPDLVSATLGNFQAGDTATDDYIDYKFDEAVTNVVTATQFFAYDAAGDEITTAGPAIRSTADNTVVRVFFTDGALASAVGASVRDGAVQADDGAPISNQEDEVGVANSNTNTSAGTSTVRTDGPDLNGVRVNPVTDLFGVPTGNYTATYSFDEQLASLAVDASKFRLYAGNGDFITATNCAVDSTGTPAQPTNTVTCDAFTGTAGQPNQAVLGTVDDGAVDDFEGGANTNPEGAEVVTGSTAGSPQS